MPVSKRTIQGFFRLIRAVLALKDECREPFHGSIECDETTFGGRRKGKRCWGASGKIIVFGCLQRNGIVKVFPVQGAKVRRLSVLLENILSLGVFTTLMSGVLTVLLP